MPDTNQVRKVLQDPNFHALPVEERTKVLAKLDSNFAALPSEEQVKVVSRGAVTVPTGNQQEPGAISRYTQSLRSGMGLSSNGGFVSDIEDFGAGLKHIATHPIDSASLLLHGMTDAQQQVIDKAYEEQHSPGIANKARGFIRGIYSAIPGAGPLLSQAGDEFSSGNIAGGLGSMTPLVTPELAKRGAAINVRDVSNAVGRAYDTVRPGPDVAPGLTSEATANLTNKSARLGMEDVFRASGPSAGEPSFRERLTTAAPDIAQIQRNTPLETSGGFINPDFRIREFVTNADKHLDNLWNEQRMPQIQRNAAAVRSLDPIKQSILGSVSDLDSENYPGAVQEINRKIMSMPDTETLGQLNDRLREVNAQRNAYRGMTPQERAAANITSPKMDALNGEYHGLQQVISDELANRGEPGVQDFDRRYGALSEVRDALRDQMNPTEGRRASSTRCAPGSVQAARWVSMSACQSPPHAAGRSKRD
jgi:hypothetical protein